MPQASLPSQIRRESSLRGDRPTWLDKAEIFVEGLFDYLASGRT